MPDKTPKFTKPRISTFDKLSEMLARNPMPVGGKPQIAKVMQPIVNYPVAASSSAKDGDKPLSAEEAIKAMISDDEDLPTESVSTNSPSSEEVAEARDAAPHTSGLLIVKPHEHDNKSYVQVDESIDAQMDESIAVLHDKLQSVLLQRHGAAISTEADILRVLTERKMLQDVVIELFDQLGLEIPKPSVMFESNEKTTARIALFGNRIISLHSIVNAAVQAKVVINRLKEDITASTKELALLKTTVNSELASAQAKQRAADEAIGAAVEARKQADNRFATFAASNSTLPFVLRGTYRLKKKGKEEVSKPRTIFLGVPPKAKRGGEGVYLSKYFLPVADIAQALRFETFADAQAHLVAIRKRADKLDPKVWRKSKVDCLSVSRIFFEVADPKK